MTRPELAADDVRLGELLDRARTAADRPVVLVPTMGALHEGHATLMREARRRAGDSGLVVVSVFVNPMQFGVGEDLDRYPRTLDADLEVCGREGADVVFAPAVELVYPTWPTPPGVTLDPGPLGEVLEGRTRPGHFRGVLTVVSRLLGLTRPTVAVFGEKDYQQLVLVRQMSRWTRPEVEIAGVATVREADGVALSSRNRYLDPAERNRAAVLSAALRAAAEAAAHGVAAARGAAREVLAAEPAVDVDYLAVTDPELADLPDDAPAGAEGRVLVAARVGTTRLIDNLPVRIGAEERTR